MGVYTVTQSIYFLYPHATVVLFLILSMIICCSSYEQFCTDVFLDISLVMIYLVLPFHIVVLVVYWFVRSYHQNFHKLVYRNTTEEQYNIQYKIYNYIVTGGLTTRQDCSCRGIYSTGPYPSVGILQFCFHSNLDKYHNKLMVFTCLNLHNAQAQKFHIKLNRNLLWNCGLIMLT